MPFKLKGSPFYRNFGIGKAPTKPSMAPQLSPEEAKVITYTQQAEKTSTPAKARFGIKNFLSRKFDQSGFQGGLNIRDFLIPSTMVTDYKKEKAWNESFGGRQAPKYNYSTKESFADSMNPNAWGKYFKKDYYPGASYDAKTGDFVQGDSQWIAGLKDKGMYWDEGTDKIVDSIG